jgi:hypothetical protein
MNASRNWTSQCPPYESQYSATTHVDADNCLSESLCHIIYMLTGVRYSPRALANMSGTTPEGNDVLTVLKAANSKGLIRYELWPDPDDFTWASYYAPIPPEILAQAEFLDITLVTADLSVSPLWTQLFFPTLNTKHMVAQITGLQYFDSEIGAPIKLLSFDGAIIQYQTSIIINKPPMNTFVETMNYNGTVGLFVPVSNPAELPLLNNIFGTNLTVNADGSISTTKTVVDK